MWQRILSTMRSRHMTYYSTGTTHGVRCTQCLGREQVLAQASAGIGNVAGLFTIVSIGGAWRPVPARGSAAHPLRTTREGE